MNNKNIKKLLIANRGEIACRIIKTAKKCGIETISIYSDTDRDSLHVRMSDTSVCLGESDPQLSYLNIDKILQVALETEADAIHPGYGFLSENAAFAETVVQRGFIWIGPSPEAIRLMGSKKVAKSLMTRAKVPVIPGLAVKDFSDNALKKVVNTIKFPLIIKASSGGGGKGMRVVYKEDDLAGALAAAGREAQASFGDSGLIIEQYLERPRHVEVQVLFDQAGQGVYLFDRDCSVQRRYQKIIEEAPAPGLSDDLRSRLGEVALQAARSINYCGAGTVEFLLDGSDNFYFMEMNTRLQVEHPVTEMITGLDLVALQFSVAEGAPLGLQQKDIKSEGHAIEVRLYAENPANSFLPASGVLDCVKFPEEKTVLRVETGVQSGDCVSSWYDPMLAKLVVWGEDRSQALREMLQALHQTHLYGVSTNRDFLIHVLKSANFQEGKVHTGFLTEDDFTADNTTISDLSNALFALTVWRSMEKTGQAECFVNSELPVAWQLHLPAAWVSCFETDQCCYKTSVFFNREHGTYSAEVIKDPFSDQKSQSCFMEYSGFMCQEHYVSFCAEDRSDTLYIYSLENDGEYVLYSAEHTIVVNSPDYMFSEQHVPDLSAPMNGRIISILVQEEESIGQNQPLLIMEAMKMEYVVKAPFAGKVKALYYREGDRVMEGSKLAEIH